MTYDNQWFPLGGRPYSRKNEYSSAVIPELFGCLADRSAHIERGMKTPKDGGLFELFGIYDLNAVATSLQITGKPNPLRSEWQGSQILWAMGGKLEALGADLYYYQSLSRHFEIGASLLVMNVKTNIDFRFVKGITFAGSGDFIELDNDRLQASEELGINCYVSNESGLGDLDFYIRAGNMWHYPDKFRRIDAGLRVGILAPTGKKRNINNPASVPFAGDGRWGLYAALDTEFELKEDIKIGFWMWVINRWVRTGTFRLPVTTEPYNFGAMVGEFKSNPELSLVAFPYVLWEDIREGLGAAVSYLYVRQFAGTWEDKRCDQTIPVNLCEMRHLSTWTGEYVSVNILYDLSKRIGYSEMSPLFSLYWDVPVHFLGEKRVSRTNRITLGVQFNY